MVLLPFFENAGGQIRDSVGCCLPIVCLGGEAKEKGYRRIGEVAPKEPRRRYSAISKENRSYIGLEGT